MPGRRPIKLRRALTTAAVAVGLAAPLALAAEASAAVYCVPDNTIHPSCEVPNASIQGALTAAQNSTTEADTVRIGPGEFNVANSGYSDAANADVQIIGAGTGATTLKLVDTNGSKTGMIFSAPAGSTMQDFSLLIDANLDVQGDQGLSLGGFGTTRNVNVTGPTASNAVGVFMQGAAILDDSTVDLEVTNSPQNFAVRGTSGQPTVTDSVLVGDIGLNQFGLGSTATVERSTIRAQTGLSLDTGAIVANSTVIDLGSLGGARGISAENPNNGTSAMDVTADHLTIVGGGASSIGVAAVADSAIGGDPDDITDDGETATVSLSNSVISGPATAVFAGADRGESATLTTSYSNYDGPAIEDPDLSGGNATGFATLTETSKTTHATPGFVNQGAGDFHLLSTSPLIDIGDPATPTPGALDIDGDARALDGTLDCFTTARRDVGADEFVGPGLLDCIAPDTAISGKKKLTAKKKKLKVRFTISSTESGSFECSLDGAPFSPCSSSYSARVKRGKHTLSARSSDASGNTDLSPASRAFTVKKKKGKKKTKRKK